jgi:hypothetical protein
MTFDFSTGLERSTETQPQTHGLDKHAQDVRFRCPHCQKLYCTQNNVFEGSPIVHPAFDCVSCHKSFSLTREVNEFGLYVTSTASQIQFAACPKCSHLRPLNSDECPSCGVIVSKFEEMQKVESPYLFELNQMWQKVLADFTSDEAHQKFISACHRKMALNFAFKKYSELKNTLGFDLACDHYMRQVELRLEEQFKAQELKQSAASRPRLSRTQIIFWSVAVVGVCSLIFNKIRPTFPNLTGLVVAITILSVGLALFSTDQGHIKLENEKN